MKRFFKITITVLFISLLAVIGLISFIDPNRYKNNIVATIQKYINQPFAINGDLSWHLWPDLALSIQDAQLGDQSNLLQIKQMNIKIHILPLLKQQLDMTIKDFTMHWQDGTKETFNAKLENINLQMQGLERTAQQIKIDTVHIDQLHIEKIYFDLLKMLLTLNADRMIIHDLTIDHFALGKLSFSSLETSIDAHENLLILQPFNAELFKGKLTGDMTLHFTQNPEAQINAHIQHADLSQLLRYMASDNQITGDIDLDLKVMTSGLDSLVMQHQAQGNAKLHIEHCIYHGSHLGKALKDTVTSINSFKDAEAVLIDSITLSTAMIAQNEEGNKITGTLTIDQGIVDAIDLRVNDQFPIKRYGPIDLPHELIGLCFDFHKKS